MRNVLLSTVALMALTGSALAADLPSRKAAAPVYVAPVPAFSWTGFYVGVEGGASFLSTNASGFATNNQTAGLIGGVVGYNYEFPNRFVLGLEGDAGGVIGAKKTYANPVFTTDSSYFADIRGRIGYAIADRALLFAAGGVAFGDTTFNSVSQGRVGWTVGGGVDYAFTNNLIGRVEYRYTDLGRQTVNNVSVRQDSNAVLVGLLYKFGAPDYAPVVAKY
ncbi:outer membrane beta-barrel protein [Rhodoblastus acidophilus]|uniref:Outer membrane beta-barrel protein n=1 Tax=Rhodoblastus acidophilus TaxID=1074 RepID=A0A6N8DJH4_RHOAC|nr:outer membrane protein [Rhodoblastus acidophilus]MCW2272464.1 outer membrane immunogenic protein [Rhodoblastus acidophilus]MTV29381.1 outer membrane beta-barrel protein [Rhodoblastus acidophilus]